MWVCRYCETENEDTYSTCVCCGYEKAVSETSHNSSNNQESRVNVISANNQASAEKRSGLNVAVLLAAIIAALIVCYLTVHIWTPATCTEPETCSICGKERSPAAGHKWVSATCTKPETCSVCGSTGSAVLGHNWIPATYETPKTCSRCGQQTGQVKGYIGDLSGTWGKKKANIRGSQRTRVFELTTSVKNCRKVTMVITVTGYSGNPFGTWYLYARNLKGKWKHIGDFKLSKKTIYDTHSINFVFDTPVSFDALTILQRDTHKYNLTYELSFTDAQQTVD